MRASVATDLVRIFRMTLPRCIFTVTSLIERSLATCLLEPGRHESHHLPFTGRQEGISFPQQSNLRALPASVLVYSNRRGNGVNQILIPYRFGEEVDRASLHTFHGHGNIAVAGH